jgi:hypothetical protein
MVPQLNPCRFALGPNRLARGGLEDYLLSVLCPVSSATNKWDSLSSS